MPMPHTLTALALCATLTLAPTIVWGQTALSATELYAKARALLDTAVAAHGGMDALRTARKIRITMDGIDYRRGQSRRATPPWDAMPFEAEMLLDLDRGRAIWTGSSNYPGGFNYRTRFLTDSSRAFNVDLRRRTHSAQDYPPAESQVGNLYYLPQFPLLHASANLAGLRWLGRIRLSSGAEADAITTSTPYGPLTLALEPGTRRLRATIDMRANVPVADAAVEVEYLDYADLGGVLVPARRVRREAGEVTQDYGFRSATAGYEIPDSMLSPPSGSTAASSTPPEPVRELAPGVWALLNGGMYSLVVAFQDQVLVVEAPPWGAADAIAQIATLAPGKPIRYVVPTHHHEDHSNGVRQYAAAGSTVVTTPANRAHFAQLIAAQPASSRALSAQPVVETISRSPRVFSDGRRTVEIHNIGAGPHAEEMLIAWIPDERILFQGDLIDVPLTGEVLPGSNNETTAHFAQWLQRRNWNVRVYGGAHGFLKSPKDFDAILAQPLPTR
jgi:glyoxylase-like metal-dependent hydrolase (beta-lactamase superfamily II)